MYLKTVYELEEERVVPLRARIAERLHHSGPTVSQTVGRMERDGLLQVEGDRHLELSDLGRQRATRVMRKHRLAERLLTDVIKLDWELVHDEACRWEHVISEEVEQRLVELLGAPTESPYGNPIPGLAELGATGPVAGFRDDNAPLDEMLGTGPLPGSSDVTELVLRRIGEELQKDVDLIATFRSAGIEPGSQLCASADETGFLLQSRDGAKHEIAPDAAVHLFVSRA
jgi:DtxR family Mn-dependent transcriptional regulator